nr:type II toxin-antitoxin system RatA family toxin [Gammaproteobacteria bacterium]
MFSVVADVERYPEFLPLWEEAEVVEQHGDSYYTDQVILLGVKPLHFRSKTVLKHPTDIEVTAAEGLFRQLVIRWHFEPASASTCYARCTIAYQMQSPIWQIIIDPMLSYATQSTVSAFEKRAHDLYGAVARLPSLRACFKAFCAYHSGAGNIFKTASHSSLRHADSGARLPAVPGGGGVHLLRSR